MFNSPLQFCAKCKQYVELDQTKEQCAALQNCSGESCPLSQMFRPPAPADEMKAAAAEPKGSSPK